MGQSVLFTDLAQGLAEVITEADTTVSNFNSSFAEGMELFKPIDLELIRSYASQQVNRVMAYIVDMAKCETFDCLGEDETATKFAERYR